MRKYISAVLAAAVIAVAAPVALTATAVSADAAEVVRKPSVKITVGPRCDWSTGETIVRGQLDNSASNVFTQFQLNRKGDAKAPGIKYQNVGADHRAPFFVRIPTGKSVDLTVRAPQMPAGKRLLFPTKTYRALADCKVDIHNPRGSINSAGLATMANAGDFVETYKVEWQNGGSGSYSVVVPAGTTTEFQPHVHGTTTIGLYVRNTDGTWRLLDDAVVTK